MANNTKKSRRGSWFNRAAKGIFLLSLLYTVSRMGCNAKQQADYLASLGANGQQQQMLERGLADNSLLEQQLLQQGKDPLNLDNGSTLADFLQQGETPDDMKYYPDRNRVNPRSGKTPREMDAQSLLLAAKEWKFNMDPQKQDPGTTNTNPNKGPKRYLNDEHDRETGHE